MTMMLTLNAIETHGGSLKADVLNHFTYENVIINQALIEVLQEYVD
jgi:hypothetical protein